MEDGTCEGCFYALPTVSDDGTEPLVKCRRYPPTIVVLDGAPIAVNPDAEHRCGEYRPPDKWATATADEMLDDVLKPYPVGWRFSHQVHIVGKHAKRSMVCGCGWSEEYDPDPDFDRVASLERHKAFWEAKGGLWP